MVVSVIHDSVSQHCQSVRTSSTDYPAPQSYSYFPRSKMQ